jgi:hypothetical protein
LSLRKKIEPGKCRKSRTKTRRAVVASLSLGKSGLSFADRGRDNDKRGRIEIRPNLTNVRESDDRSDDNDPQTETNLTQHVLTCNF